MFNNRIVHFLLLGFIFNMSSGLQAQPFGGFPPSFQWQYKDNDTVRVVFPKGLDNLADRVMGNISYLNKNNRTTIGEKDGKISIVLQNQTVESNGYVALAPFRSEFFLTPIQESNYLGSLPWVDLLSIHEYRHVLQYLNAKRGSTKVLYFLYGQSGWAFGANLAVPNWFWEGDAVATETALTKQGRGRLPRFFNPYKSLLNEGIKYSYMKARNGSLKDFVPNHYNLGYQLCAYGWNRYGNDFWKKVFNESVTYQRPFYPFSRSIRANTPDKKNATGFYKDMLDDYQSKWKQEAETLNITDAGKYNKVSKKKTYTTYRYPYFVNDSTIIVYKASYKKIGAYYLIDNRGNEKRLIAQGNTTDSYFSYKNNKIIWTELRFHPRWGWFDYSVIKTYDLITKRQKQLSFKTKYFSPDFSSDHSKIAVVEVLPSGKSILKILDGNTGIEIASLPNPEDYFFTYPKWTPDDKAVITSVRNKEGEMAMIKVEVETGALQNLTPFYNHVSGISFPTDQYIFFESSYSGIDNIYAIKQGQNEIYQVTSRIIGNYQPAVDPSGKKLVFSEFNRLGDNIFQMQLIPGQWKTINPIPLHKQDKFDFAGITGEGGNILEKVNYKEYNSHKYKKTKGLFNLHSWFPNLIHPDYSISLQSDNILNTFTLSTGVNYNVNEQSTRFSFDAIYGGLYPLINIGYNRQIGRSYLSNRWNEDIWSAGISVPLNISSGVFSRGITFNSYYNYLRLKYYKKDLLFPDIDFTASYGIHVFKTAVSFYNIRRKALQNIYPKWSQYFNVGFNKGIVEQNIYQFMLLSEYSFPGLFTNHNFVIQGDLMATPILSSYQFLNSFFYSRGYPAFSFQNYVYKAGFNYYFPIAYPDFGFGGIVYFLRIRGNFFFDYGKVIYFNDSKDLNASGGEIILDIKWFNAVSFPLGFRGTYILNPISGYHSSNGIFEIFIPVRRL